MPTRKQAPRPRVFISCGQRCDELVTANAIKRRLHKLGFEVFVALQEQTLEGVKEHIFKSLANSEYFIFVDFMREQPGGTDHYRRSLFSHQELAVASYLGVEVLAFREAKPPAKEPEGLLAYIMGNATTFTDRATLPDKIGREVEKRLKSGRWKLHWRNELVLERRTKKPDHSDGVPIRSKFFGISVHNLHPDRAATNCYAYLERATHVGTGKKIQDPHTFELKWEGYTLPNANIPPGKSRQFDALSIRYDCPTKVQFLNNILDWIGQFPSIEGKGHYELDYLVLSDNFSAARGTFILNLASQISATSLRKKDPSVRSPSHKG